MKISRWSLIIVGFLLLVFAYFTQRLPFAVWLGLDYSPSASFIINKTIRLIINDCACLMIISGWFDEAKYLKAATWVFVVELLVILPIYFFVKLSFEGSSEMSSPLLSQIHRLIVNPLLMFLLMMGFVVQRLQHKRS